MVERDEPGLVYGLALGRDIDRARRIIAHENHGDARRDSVSALERCGFRGHAWRASRAANALPSMMRALIACATCKSRAERSVSSPSTSIVFSREVAPDAIRTSDFLTSSARAKRSMSAVFALPSSGGAATRAFRAA